MSSRSKLFVIAGLLVGMVGCAKSYEDRRPPIDQLDARDKGLQSKDLVNATDQMTAELLSLPELNISSRQWTIVGTTVENETTRAANYNIFIDRLRTNLAKQGRGRVTLIENLARYKDLQNRELEQPRDEFSQGTGGRASYAGIQPDYALYGKVQEMPNRGTSTYRFEFTLTNFKTRAQVWSGEYLVRVER